MKSLAILLILLIVTPSSFAADELNLSDLKDYYGEFSDKRKIIIEAVFSRDDLSIDEKTALYEAKMASLKGKFISKRSEEYESKSKKLGATHSCTKGDSGGKKQCGFRCVNAPRYGTYTQRDWVEIKGDRKRVKVTDDMACISLSRASKGRSEGKVYAIFKYEPTYIANTTLREQVKLFNWISKVE